MYENTISEDIKNIQTIYITGHVNPDGDCIGSAFGFALAMAGLGKTPVILLGDYAERFNTLKGCEYVYKGDYSVLEPEIMFSIDCGSKDRLGEAEAVFDRAKYTYNIDHHMSNTAFADVNIVNASASSSCEVIYELISPFVRLDRDIAQALYTGILTDTGGFMHNSTAERTHEIAGRLVSLGADTPVLHSRFMHEHSLGEAKILACAIEKMQLQDGIAYTAISAEDMKKCGVSAKELDAVVSYLINTEGARAAVFACERGDIIKLSFRSKSVNVGELAKSLGGGGHKLAAGAGVEGDLETVLENAVSRLKKLM